MKKINKNSGAETLREKAENLLLKTPGSKGSKLSETDILKLIHELEVHQIELEIQNQELLDAKEQAESIAGKYQNLFDFAPTGYFTLSKEGKIIELNLQGASMMGKARSALINRPFGLYISEATRPVFNTFLGDVFKEEKKVSCELSLATSASNPVHVYLTGITDENRESCFVTLLDITDRKHAEEQLVLAREKAEESDRLKSAFLANMSHEIRTPMNGLLGFADLLKEPGLTGEEQEKYLGVIHKSGLRLLNIINDIIDISKIESGQMTINNSEVNVNEKIDSVFNFLKPQADNKGLVFSCHCPLPDRMALIKTDNLKINAILINLVHNAIKFTDKGFVEFGYGRKDSFLEFYIKDSGTGISPDQQKLVFERFRQEKKLLESYHEGTGLGLSISKAYVELMGGKIWMESTPDIGSTFYFTIPYKPRHVSGADHSVDSQDGAKNLSGRLKILIAEDDEASEFFLQTMVKSMSTETLFAKTGNETVEICRNNPDLDLVLMDIRMPGIDGYEATRQIRKFNKDVIIIAQTAYGLAGDREKAIDAGCNGYISKPFEKDIFRAALNQFF